jgi:hypothetical protein
MKIHELYSTILAVIDGIATPSYTTNASHMIALYTDYAIEKQLSLLRQLMAENNEKELANGDVHLLEALFADYYNVVKKTQYVAPHDPQSKLTIAYLTLAQELETITGKSRYQYLLPDVNVVEYEASSMSLHDHELKLTDFVLSDDDTSVIEVLASLDFAVDDGVLKHTRLFDGQMRVLSDAEAKRVIHHSKEAKDYWDAIQEKLNIELNGSNAKAALKRLINYLARGGEHGHRGGEEQNAAADANVGIQEFFAWFNALDTNDQALLSAMTAPGMSYTLGNLLSRLSTPTVVNLDDTRFCVELIGGNIDRIVAHHPELSDIPSVTNAAVATSVMLEQAETHVKDARERLEIEMQSQRYQVTRGSYPESEIYFLNNISRIPDLLKYLARKKLIFCFNTPDRIITFINQIDQQSRLGFLQQISPAIEQISYISWDDISAIIASVHGDIGQMSLTKLLAKKICTVIRTMNDLKNIVEKYKPENITPLIKILYEENRQLFYNDSEKMEYILCKSDDIFFSDIKNHIADNIYFCFHENNCFYKRLFRTSNEAGALKIDMLRRGQLINGIQSKVISIYKNVDEFATALNNLPESKWEDIFSVLRYARAATLYQPNGFVFDDNHLLSICMRLSSRTGQSKFLSIIGSSIKDKEAFKKEVEEKMPQLGLAEARRTSPTSSSSAPERTHVGTRRARNTEHISGNTHSLFNNSSGFGFIQHDRERENRISYSNREILATVEALREYGLTEEYLRQHIRTAGTYSGLETTALVYLVTGHYPLSLPFDNGVRDLPIHLRLTPAQAIIEINELNGDKLSALEKLYTLGLRGDQLRAHSGTFMCAHTSALVHLMTECRPPLGAQEAVERIRGLSYDQANEIAYGDIWRARGLRGYNQ